MAHDNLALLTKSHSAITAKKRAKHGQIKEIVFDEVARRTFLTGFHKRKVARREEAKKNAQLREKQERLELRREHRRALAERAARNAAEVERACGAFGGDEMEWSGVGGGKADDVEEEYEGEEQLATVTVVQNFDVDALLHGPPGPARRAGGVEETRTQTRTRTRARRKSVKYESKAARGAERRKQLARKAERARK